MLGMFTFLDIIAMTELMSVLIIKPHRTEIPIIITAQKEI